MTTMYLSVTEMASDQNMSERMPRTAISARRPRSRDRHLEGVQRARADVAVNDADGADHRNRSDAPADAHFFLRPPFFRFAVLGATMRDFAFGRCFFFGRFAGQSMVPRHFGLPQRQA